jgi:hypothetical protein
MKKRLQTVAPPNQMWLKPNSYIFLLSASPSLRSGQVKTDGNKFSYIIPFFFSKRIHDLLDYLDLLDFRIAFFHLFNVR